MAKRKKVRPEDIVFTPEDIAAVQAAIDRAHEDMKEWRKASYVSPEKMRQPIGPPGGYWPHQRRIGANP